jgi:CelD/BcsL family acetyltransferase involved in cellulose biosynthesis
VRHFKTAENRLLDLTALPGRTAASRRGFFERALPLGAQLSLLSSVGELQAVESQWRALERAASRSHNVFQSFAWVFAWAKTYVMTGGNEIAVVTGCKADRLVFVLPLMKTRKGPVGVLQWLSEPFGQYGDILLAPGEDAGTWMSAAWPMILNLPGVDAVRLRHVRQDATIQPYLGRHFRSARVADGAPFMDLAQFASEAAYERRYSKEQRKRRKRIHKELEAMGPVDFRLLTGGANLDQAIDEAIAQKQAWLKERRLFSRALACPRIGSFVKELARSGKDSVTVVASVLTAGDRPISWEIGLRFKDRHHGFITAHDVALTDKSPARLHMDRSQRRALADGFKIFDLMVPMDAHKESWSSAVMPVDDYYRATSWAGWIYGRLYLETVRPALRQAYYNSSSQFRDAICKLTRSNALFMH